MIDVEVLDLARAAAGRLAESGSIAVPFADTDTADRTRGDVLVLEASVVLEGARYLAGVGCCRWLDDLDADDVDRTARLLSAAAYQAHTAAARIGARLADRGRPA